MIEGSKTRQLSKCLLLDNVTPLGNIETVKELDCALAKMMQPDETGKIAVADLSDILVPDSARLLDVCGALGDLLEIVTAEDELILLVLGSLDINTVLSNDLADDLLAQEVADLNLPEASLAVLVEVDVDGEMGVDVAHLVLEAF